MNHYSLSCNDGCSSSETEAAVVVAADEVVAC